MATKASKETIISIDDYANHRDGKGRFTKGNPGGPGRPARATEEEYLLALRDTIPLERWQRMIEKIADHIEETGSIRAFVALADRMLGKPAVTVHDDGQDGYRKLAALMEGLDDDEDDSDDEE